MIEETQLSIQLLTEKDLPEAMRLVEPANWNQTKNDWLRLFRLDPRGCFGARVCGSLVGTITTITYGAELAWIGMMFVAPEYRRRGIATKLMQVAMDYLRARGVVTVKLDTTAVGRPLYETLGFVREGLIERWEAVAYPAGTRNLSALDIEMWPALESLDRKAFHADRANLLDTFFKDSCVPALAFITPNGSLQGYALARSGTAACYVGPVVATDEQVALSLLDAMINQLAGERLYLDFHTGFGGASSALLKRGFVKHTGHRVLNLSVPACRQINYCAQLVSDNIMHEDLSLADPVDLIFAHRFSSGFGRGG